MGGRGSKSSRQTVRDQLGAERPVAELYRSGDRGYAVYETDLGRGAAQVDDARYAELSRAGVPERRGAARSAAAPASPAQQIRNELAALLRSGGTDLSRGIENGHIVNDRYYDLLDEADELERM